MKKRIEQKIEIERDEYTEYLKWLKLNGATILYPERQINSLYFDNSRLEMFHDTAEGIVPRKKLRLRAYGKIPNVDFYESGFFEKKLTTEYSRFKSINPVQSIDKLIDQGIYDSQYGQCFPKANISYSRSYYSVLGCRVTIDTNILYSSVAWHDLRMPISEPNFVLEIKTSAETSKTHLQNIFEFPRTRFSKYERAIEALFF